MKLNYEQKRMMDRAIKYASLKEIIIWVWWSIFYPHKSEKLIKCVEYGLTWQASFLIARLYKRK